MSPYGPLRLHDLADCSLPRALNMMPLVISLASSSEQIVYSRRYHYTTTIGTDAMLSICTMPRISGLREEMRPKGGLTHAGRHRITAAASITQDVARRVE